MADLHVFLHTNVAPELAFRPPPRGSGFVAVHGWSSANVSAARQAFEQCCYRAPWALHAVHKYAWLLARSASMEMPSGAPMILADNDVLFQCTPSELISRFHSFGTPLVVGGERRWFPIPNSAHDPFGPRATLTWKQRYELRHHNQFYPNSGLIMGTAHGFHALQRAMHERNERFPCCAFEGEQGGFTLDPCTSCKPPRTFQKRAPCVVDDDVYARRARKDEPPFRRDPPTGEGVRRGVRRATQSTLSRASSQPRRPLRGRPRHPGRPPGSSTLRTSRAPSTRMVSRACCSASPPPQCVAHHLVCPAAAHRTRRAINRTR